MQTLSFSKTATKVTLFLRVAGAISALLLPANICAAIQYQITNLGPNTEALSINDLGVIAGNTQTNTGSGHFGIYADGSWTDLGKGYANDINNAGVVVGAISRNITPPSDLEGMRAYIYSNGSFTYPNPAPKNGSFFYGVNEAGSAVGSGWYPSSSGSHAILFQNGAIVDIGSGNGWAISNAAAINNNNVIVGYYQLTDSSPSTAFIYNNGTVTPLGTLGGASSVANAINNSGVVVGGSFLSGNSIQHAFSYFNGTMTDLGSLYGLSSYAFGINDSAQAVGSFYNVGSSFAALWEGGSALDLNTLIEPSSGWLLKQANDINESGQIVGYGSYNGVTSAFLLTPVPEPSVMAMALIGFLCMGGVLIRNRAR